MKDSFEPDFCQPAAAVQTYFLSDSQIEVAITPPADAQYEHVLFDFDGTLSLIREGWPEVMIPMMVEHLRMTGTTETQAALHRLVTDYVMELNGKQTIYQMMRLADEIRSRGGAPREPLDYKQEYHERLMERIQSRRDGLARGDVLPEAMLVPGTMTLLEGLRGRGVRLYLASGTDVVFVREEVQLLGLDRFFEDRVYGAVDDYKSFSKAMVIQQILRDHAVDGSRLLGFGDGYVEIQNVRSAGGTAIGVASDETHRSGQPDRWKRARLLGVGAHLIVPDFRETERLLELLWKE